MPEGSLSDALILAALERAQRHARRTTPGARGVGYVEVVPHLGLPKSAAVGRRLRPRFKELEAAGLIAGVKSHGSVKYTTTRKGRQLLAAAEPITLPESPQHRRWREAHETATERISDSEAWFTLSEKLERACSRLASATHCLHEWAEPDDATADIDKSRRWKRRDVTLWRS